MTDKLIVQLHGGIGNQLFQYYAGAALAQFSSKSLTLDARHISNGIETHVANSISADSSVFEEFDLPGKLINVESSVTIVEKFTRRLLRDTSYFNERLLTPKLFGTTYNSKCTGYDEMLLESKSKRVGGYFQTFYYFDLVTKIDPRYFPQTPLKSPWSLQAASAMSDDKSIVLHIRKHQTDSGSKFVDLNKDYYDFAISRLTQKLGRKKIYVFAKPGLDISSYVSNDYYSRIQVISPPDGTKDWESLSLMAKASSLVIANSTFSWWSAKLSSPSSDIFAPKRVFVNAPNPVKYYPEGWQLI